MPLARSKRDERSDAAARDLVAHADVDLALDDDDPRALPHLMVVHRLSGLEANRDRTRPVLGRQHLRVDHAARRLDLHEVPRLHGSNLA